MAPVLARRVAKIAAMVLAIVVVNFLLIHAAPGDPASALAGQSGQADEQFMEQLRSQFGLDKPLPVQLWIYLKHVLTLDLGISHRLQRPVLALILERLPATLLLTGSAFTFALLGGIALGVCASRRPGGIVDSLIAAVSLVFYATPLFWVAILLVIVFGMWLEWLPTFGLMTVGVRLQGIDLAIDVIRHAILPVVTLALYYSAVYVRLTRSSMMEVATQPFVRTALAKGASDARVTWVHVLRNALLPVITIAGIQVGHLVGGSVLVETVFAWPGIGSLAFDALLSRDYELLLGIFLCTSVLVLVVNLLTDLLYLAVDPRVQAL
ncbi:ABC transporter permease [Bradyrhizobium erythrophlei]|uniref:ABC transporter permease n=1 Tax=Bradyrhizobium erythrophlei TaxID=1437360 RepID=UPI0035E957FD